VRVLVAILACLLALPASAARLPFRAYGAAEGLEANYVRFVMQDSRGFLWLATNGGVSRFDGHEFRNYGADDGLPFPSARKIVETKDGGILVLGRGKLARRGPGFSLGGPEFTAVAPPGLDGVGDIYDVAVAPDGSVAVVGTTGVARLSGDRVGPLDLGPLPGAGLPDAEEGWAAAFDGSGALWVARSYGITRVGADGRPRTLVLPPEKRIGSGWGWLPSMMVDRRGSVWLLTVSVGAWRLAVGEDGVPSIAETIGDNVGVRGYMIRALHESPEGTFWIGTANSALARVERTAAGARAVRVGAAEGFPDLEVSSLLTDGQGNLWVGTMESGLVRLAEDGLISWGEADGLRPAGVGQMLDEPGGVLALLGGLSVGAVRDGRVDAPRPIRGLDPGWGAVQLVATDASGRVWLATARGPAVYARGTQIHDLPSRRPERVLDKSDGLSGTEVHRVFATSEGTIWLGLVHNPRGVCRVEPNGGRVRCFGPEDGLPEEPWGDAFAQDDKGHVWVGLYGGGVFRFRDGKFESWPEGSPNRQSQVFSIRRDREGRLWVAGSPGLLRIDGASGGTPSFRRYGREAGVRSADTFDVAQDRFGQIYVSGSRGVDRIDPEGGAIRRYTSEDGLPANRATVLHADAQGDIWVGTTRGIARLTPVRAGAKEPPRVYVFLHGFTDAPTQFATVGGHLFADGANVYIPRLPHHAERVSPLRAIGRVRSDELARFADSTTQIARGLGDTIVVVGLSAGGVLAGWIAEHHPEVHRTVLIAPAIAPGRIPNGEGAGLVILASKLPEVVRMTAPIDTARPENIPGVTTRGLAELLRLGQRVRDQADIAPPSVHDIVFLLNEADRTVSEDAALGLARQWAERGATPKAYRFFIGAKLPHNVMELTSHGGNTKLVYPIIEALARQGTADSPEIVELLGAPCGFWCRLRSLFP